MKSNNAYYITTPIYYPSGHWTIGTCYTTVICDGFARYNRMKGKKVFFLTGTDEHGQKIEKKAAEKGITPMEFINPLVDELKNIWKSLDISYDRFIRTTDPDHIATVQAVFKKLYEQGDIYKSEYEGWYCTPCESFWTDSQLKDGKCPDCGREVHKDKEESYFFRLSKYTDKILKLYEDNPEFLQPVSRMNEMVNNFLKPGLSDLCVSRTSVKWGIPVSFDEKHTVYVWIDALTNYLSALGYGTENDENFKTFWPADVHMTGKEIIRFHAIIWPAILMALGLELPKRVYGHGWLLIGGDKLSKSKADAIGNELTDPLEIIERYGSDALRYFLLRDVPFGNDGVYTNEAFLTRINSDLCNDLGNLVSRTCAMINQYFGGVLYAPNQTEKPDFELVELCEKTPAIVDKAMDALNVSDALSAIFAICGRANKYVDETTPWILAREGKTERLKTVLYNLAESVRFAALLLKPFLTVAPDKILALFGCENLNDFTSLEEFGYLKEGTKVSPCAPLFPRIDIKKELADIDKMMTERKKAKAAAEKAALKAAKPAEEKEEAKPQIGIEDFAKVELRVASVTACEKVAKSDKLLKLTLSLGDETRTVASGIAKYYTPEEMVGKKVVLVANLKPAVLRGVTSEGMILCSESNGVVKLVEPAADMPDGSVIR